jgi:hypothetical protein
MYRQNADMRIVEVTGLSLGRKNFVLIKIMANLEYSPEMELHEYIPDFHCTPSFFSSKIQIFCSCGMFRTIFVYMYSRILLYHSLFNYNSINISTIVCL